MNQYTPGPWHVNELGNVAAAERVLAVIVPTPDFRGKANARLISAAPALLAALKVVVQDMKAVNAGGQYGHELQWTLHQAQKAITKATGEAL